MTELKKCPLCNSDCKILSTSDDDNYPLEHHVVYCAGENCGYDAGDWRTLEKAISHHNSRPIEDALRERAEKAEARVAELEARSRWISVSEKLPERNAEDIFVIVDGKVRKDYCFEIGRWWQYDSNDWDLCGFMLPTHWMYYPEPPHD